jgi:hypothetical protein
VPYAWADLHIGRLYGVFGNATAVLHDLERKGLFVRGESC